MFIYKDGDDTYWVDVWNLVDMCYEQADWSTDFQKRVSVWMIPGTVED